MSIKLSLALTYRAAYQSLILVGLVSTWVAAVLHAESTELTVVSIEAYSAPSYFVRKSVYFYFFHAVGIFSIMLSGIFALLNRNYRLVSPSGRIACLILWGTAIIWLIVTVVSSEKYGIWEMFGSTGVFVWLATIAVFVGVDDLAWRKLDELFEILAVLTVFFLIRSIWLKESYVWIPGASSQLQHFIIYWWVGAWTFLSFSEVTGITLRRVFHLMLLPVMLIAVLYIQSRTWLVLTLILLPIRLILLSKRKDHAGLASKLAVISLAAIVVAGTYWIFADLAKQSLDGLLKRLSDDTRSSQYFYFFKSVSLADLVLGKGPEGTWYWPGVGKYQFFDNSVLWMAFIGGLPLAISYTVFVILPGFKVPFFGIKDKTVSVSSVLLRLYALMSLGFATYMSPALSLPCYMLYLMAGRCYFMRKSMVP